MKYISESQQIPVTGVYDVIVAGGGIAGVSAAVAASRLGQKVLLLEKSVILGGLATSGLINWYEPLCDGCGHQVSYGIAEELLRLSIQIGSHDLHDQWQKHKTPIDPEAKRYATHFSPTLFSLALDEWLEKEKVDIRLDIQACRPLMEGNRCSGIITESKSGREYFSAGMVIDATGDADLLFRAGLPCRTGVNYLTYVAHVTNHEQISAFIQDGSWLHLHRWNLVGANAVGKGHPEGMRTFTGTTNEDVTEFILTGRKLLYQKIKQLPVEEQEILALPGMAQFRMTRCLVGQHVLTEADACMRHENSIGVIGDFLRRGPWYEIPYTCLYHPNCDNLLTAGRTVSADGHGWQVARVIPSAAVTGQAAGTAAALALKQNCSLDRLPVSDLQKALCAAGAKCHAVSH